MTGKDVLPEKDLLQKAATMKRFKYSPLSKVLKAQTDIEKKQYQRCWPKTPKWKHTKEKIKVLDTASELYNNFLDKYFDEYYDLDGEEKEELGFRFMLINLRIKGYDYCIDFIEYMLAGKILLDYSNFCSPNDYKNNDKIIYVF